MSADTAARHGSREYLPVVWHSDPGHAWLEVNKADLGKVGLKLTDFSRFSYRSVDALEGQPIGKLYLEEDCDALVFLTAVSRYGHKLTTRPDGEIPIQLYHTDCWIRNLNRLHE